MKSKAIGYYCKFAAVSTIGVENVACNRFLLTGVKLIL